MKVYARSDLNMRKGKISSQVSHAVVGLWLAAMEQSENKFILKGENYLNHKKWIENNSPIEIIPVNSEMDLLAKESNATVLIKDQGRTEFKEPTNTCLSFFEGVEINERLSCESLSKKSAKQTLVANKDLKLNKWVLAEYSARASWFVLVDLMTDTGTELVLNLNKEGLISWLLGSFAKITLKEEGVKMPDLISSIEKNGINVYTEKKEGEIVVIATSPELVEDLNDCTNHLKLY